MSVSYAYVFEHAGKDPEADRIELHGNGQHTILVPVPTPDVAPDVASRLVEEHGVTLIELCGGFTSAAAAAVANAVDGRAAVGHVMFAADSLAAATAFAVEAG